MKEFQWFNIGSNFGCEVSKVNVKTRIEREYKRKNCVEKIYKEPYELQNKKILLYKKFVEFFYSA